MGNWALIIRKWQQSRCGMIKSLFVIDASHRPIMQDFSLVYVLATLACVALAVWLRVRLFGKLNTGFDAAATPAATEVQASQRHTAP